jgi:hypothetical protein
MLWGVRCISRTADEAKPPGDDAVAAAAARNGRLGERRGETMTDSQHPSRTEVVAYVAAMATQLAQLAGAARCGRLAHLLKAAALEARSAAGPGLDEETVQEPIGRGHSH